MMANHVQTDERVLATTVIPGAIVTDEDGLSHTADSLALVNDGVPTQVANPRRATLRTVVAVIVGLVLTLPLVNAFLLILQSELAAVTAFEIPAWIWAAINISLAVVALVGGIVTRVLAIPGVNEWIKGHVPGLAAIPLKPVE
jgi:hypothetical protein